MKWPNLYPEKKKKIWFVMMIGSKAFTKRKESLTKVTVKFYFLNIFCAIFYEKYLFLKMFFKETSRIRFINIREHFRSSFWNLVPILWIFGIPLSTGDFMVSPFHGFKYRQLLIYLCNHGFSQKFLTRFFWFSEWC